MTCEEQLESDRGLEVEGNLRDLSIPCSETDLPIRHVNSQLRTATPRDSDGGSSTPQASGSLLCPLSCAWIVRTRKADIPLENVMELRLIEHLPSQIDITGGNSDAVA